MWYFNMKVLFMNILLSNSPNLIENDHNFCFLTIKYQLSNTSNATSVLKKCRETENSHTLGSPWFDKRTWYISFSFAVMMPKPSINSFRRVFRKSSCLFLARSLFAEISSNSATLSKYTASLRLNSSVNWKQKLK